MTEAFTPLQTPQISAPPISGSPGQLIYDTTAKAPKYHDGMQWNLISGNPMTTLGDTIYGGSSGAQTRLPGNTSSTLQLLAQTGTGSVSAAPAWATPGSMWAQSANAVSLTGGTINGAVIGGVAPAAATFTSLILGGGTLLSTSADLTNGAGSNTGILTNAPVAGNPTKWVAINDNGTTRYFPTW